jgi:hypothetical protein
MLRTLASSLRLVAHPRDLRWRRGFPCPDHGRAGHTWHCSQKNVLRLLALTRTMTERQRRQAWPSRS